MNNVEEIAFCITKKITNFFQTKLEFFQIKYGLLRATLKFFYKKSSKLCKPVNFTFHFYFSPIHCSFTYLQSFFTNTKFLSIYLLSA